MAAALVHCESRSFLSRLLNIPSFRHSLSLCTVTSTGEKIDKEEKKKNQEEQEGAGERDDKAPEYGKMQWKPGVAADSAHAEWENKGSQSAHEESLEDTGYDISKRTKPAGDE